MKKILFPIYVFCLFMSSCNDPDCDPESYYTYWISGKEIFIEYLTEYDKNHYYEIDGDKIIFSYIHTGAQCDHVYDDEWGEELKFQIEDSMIQFEFVDEEILTTNCYYQEFGAWVDRRQAKVETGRITGVKLSDSKWNISIAISTSPRWENDQPTVIEFEEIFEN